jgi:pyruvate dehydrogenase E1 component
MVQPALSTTGTTTDAASTQRWGILDRIAERVLWLAVRMIHEANVVRANDDGLKVGGHQASSASVATILTTLYLDWLRPHDLVSIKPHASPVYHALTYLMGALDKAYLTELRSIHGLQSYPSRTKDPDRVDFSTGSVGLGAVAPLFASLADRYLSHHTGDADWPDRRFVAVIGDAELDEGNVWEAVLEPALADLGNVTLIVDTNRQSLDRIVPGIRVRQMRKMFRAAGWQVLVAKYGARLAARMSGPGGKALRRRLDEMPNEEYQRLIRLPGPEARTNCVDGAPLLDRDDVTLALHDVDDADLPSVLADLAGHDVSELLRVLAAADGDRSRPTAIFAYTIKGWLLPFAGDSMNHSALLTADQIAALATTLGADPADPWAGFPATSDEAQLCHSRGEFLNLRRTLTRRLPEQDDRRALAVDVRIPPVTSTQQAFSDALAAAARMPIATRIVTASPDVTISTGLGSWVNRVGVFSHRNERTFDQSSNLLTWRPTPAGQHIELGISEMNLFMWFSQFGLAPELFGQPLVPIGTVYDPFVCRGLDALIYALYTGARFILVGTPSGISLAPEGGAHQSTITTSIGIELPGLRSYEPAFAQEVGWMLEEGLRGIDVEDGFATYLRLSTRPVDQGMADYIRDRIGESEWRRQTLAGGYRLLEASGVDGLPPDAPNINVFAAGAVLPEAFAAVRELQYEEIAANLLVVTSAERLAAEIHDRRIDAVRGLSDGRLTHLDSLVPLSDRRAPMITVHDGASHALAFLGSAYGAPVVPLGVDDFGQSGRISDLYASAGIDADHIVNAALLALELA